MNIKEAFRYQTFLDKLLIESCERIQNRSNTLTVTKTHYKSKVNPEAVDVIEEVEKTDYIDNDIIVRFMEVLVKEKEILSTAIFNAKASIEFNIDASIEANKYRQKVCNAIKYMLACKASQRIDSGRDYKFNVEGNQTSYIYDIQVDFTEAFDRAKAKTVYSSLIKEADAISAEIDAAMVNTEVNYVPVFDVNDSYEDVIAAFTGI